MLFIRIKNIYNNKVSYGTHISFGFVGDIDYNTFTLEPHAQEGRFLTTLLVELVSQAYSWGRVFLR